MKKRATFLSYFIHSLSMLLLLGMGAVIVFFSLKSNSANYDSTTTSMTQPSYYDGMDQNLNVDSNSNDVTNTTQTYYSNQTFTCPTNTVMVGINVYATGSPYPGTLPTTVPRSVTTYGSYTYFPTCETVDTTWSGQCTNTPGWVQNYSNLASIYTQCATVYLGWQGGP